MSNEWIIRERLDKLLFGIMDHALFEIDMVHIEKFIKSALMELHERGLIHSNHSVKSHDGGFAYSIHCYPTMSHPTIIERYYEIDNQHKMSVLDRNSTIQILG